MNLPFDLQGDESVLLFCRRHWLYLWSKVVAAGLAGLVPILLLVVLVGRIAGLGGASGRIALVLAVLWGGYWLVRGYFTWYRYNHDIWVVSNQRIIDSLRRHWFHHRMASADLVDIEDIAVVREGILQTAFDFGDLRCQTAGEQPNFILAGIPGPARVLGVVDAARDAGRRQLGRPSSRADAQWHSCGIWPSGIPTPSALASWRTSAGRPNSSSCCSRTWSMSLRRSMWPGTGGRQMNC